MAEGFIPSDYVTNLTLSDVQGKRLWLLRVPRHIDAANLEGTKVKLPKKGREGKVLGRATSREDRHNSDDALKDKQGVCREGLVLRAADAAESHGFRALFSSEVEDGALGAATPFAGQVNVSVSVETASGPEPSSVDDLAPVSTLASAPASASASVLLEPYRGRPQLKGMRVRSKPAGAGSVYTPTPPLAGDGQGGAEQHGDGDGVDATLTTPDRRGKTKAKPLASASSSSRNGESLAPLAQTPTSAKKKKRKSTSGGGDAPQEDLTGGGEGQMSRKSKRKESVER